jgi:hypothetical protein
LLPDDEPDDVLEKLAALLSELAGDWFSGRVTRAGRRTDARARSLLQVAPSLEAQQADAWFHGARAAVVAHRPDRMCVSILGVSEISRYIRNILKKHRFLLPGGLEYRIRLGIVGPRFSGKSQLLSDFADEILLAHVCGHLHKRTFFVFVNFKILGVFLTDMAQLYRSIVELTLEGLAWQRPFLRPSLPFLRRFFLGLTESRGCPRIPANSKFAQDFPGLAASLQKIIGHVHELYSDAGAMIEYLEAVFSLPETISAAAGFSGVFWFIDNIEYADVELQREAPFRESARVCFVMGVIQLVLQRSHFVIAGETESRLLDVLVPIEIDGDLRATIEFVSPIGILCEEDERVVKVDIQDEGVPFQLTVQHCAGIPAFVALWRELNDAFDEFDQAEGEAVDDRDELLLLLLTHAQHVLDVLFVMAERSELLVTGVRRS